MEGLGKAFISCVLTDRRGRLSLLCGIPLDGKNHSNRLPLGTPPLGGGWEGFPDEGVCPYFEDSPSDNGGVSSLSREASFETKKRPLRFERGVPLIKDNTTQ